MQYDLIIIGAGWAGINAAIKAKKSGLKVAIVEKSQIGGTCLNRGCIPTKALIHSTKIYNLIKKSNSFGLDLSSSPVINFGEIQKRKEKIIQQLRRGIEFMLKGIDFLNGHAYILSSNTLKIGNDEYKTKFILIATGSRPLELKDLKFDGKKVVSSDEVLELKEMPRRFLVIGGGVIGCEFASLFSNLGSEVTIMEKMPYILPGEDKEAAKRLENIFKKRGIKVNTNTSLESLDLNQYDLVLVCIGRSPNIRDLNLDKIGVNCEGNRIVVDKCLKTNIANIYAAGDCTGKIMLAHFAAYQGDLAAENIAFPDAAAKEVDNFNIPSCIFTEPEIGSVGLSEEAAKNAGLNVGIKKIDFLTSGMARILDESEGFIKLVFDTKTEVIIGATILGPRATELIATLTLAVSSGIKLSQIKKTIFAHPTISESIAEAVKIDYAV